MTYRMHYCVPVYSRYDTGTEAAGATTTSPDLSKQNICFPKFIQDDDMVYIRVGWSSSNGRSVKVWFTDPGATLNFSDGTGVLLSLELTSTDTNYANYPVSQGSVAVGSDLGGQIRGGDACHVYVGTGASGTGGGNYVGLNIWLEGKRR